jgi:hypothetical protein
VVLWFPGDTSCWAGAVALPTALWLNWEAATLAIHAAFSVFFLACVALRLVAAFSARPPRLARLQPYDPAELPVYTVLVALYREAGIVPQLLAALSRIEWPRSKLEIKLVCEADDRETLAVLRTVRLHPCVEIIEVPPGEPRTKPKALAYAQERRQGRAEGDAGEGMSPIVLHPDVKRTLLTMQVAKIATDWFAGRELATAVRSLGGHSIGMNRSGAPVAGFDEVRPAAEWPEICEHIDHLALAVPLTPQTRNMVNATSLAMLGAHAVVVNVGRGASVDSDALLDALETERIGAGCLDVTWPDPLPEDHGLWRQPRALITSHTACPRGERVALLAAHVEDNLRLWFDGGDPHSVIDLARGY